LELDAADQEAMCNAGLALESCGQFASALPLLLQALPRVPPGALTVDHSALGRIYAALQQPQQAAASFAQALACSPRDIDLHHRASMVLLDLGEFAEARIHWLAACDLEPTNGRWPMQVGLTFLLAEDAASANTWFARALALGGACHTLDYYLAEAMYIAGEYAEAAAAFVRAAESGSQHRSRSLQQLLRAKVRLGEWDAAIAIGRDACLEYPEEKEFYRLLACVHVDAEDGPAAVAAVTAGLLQVDMADEDLWRLMYAVSLILGGIRLSNTRLQWLLDRDPDNVGLIEDLGLRAADDDDDDAMATLGHRALALKPASKTALALVSTSLRLKGDIEGMVQFLYQHGAHKSQDGGLLGNLGRGLLLLGRLTEAQWMLEAASTADPHSRIVLGNLLELYEAQRIFQAKE